MNVVGPRGNARLPLAFVSDGSCHHRDPGSSVLTDLLGAAALVREHSGIATTAALVTAADDQELVVELRRLGPEICGVYLAHSAADRARTAQDALAGELAVITDRQTTAIARG